MDSNEHSPRLCTVCEQPIPTARLKAMPTASKCVPCVVEHGDVTPIRRLDEYVGKDGEEVVSTYFKGTDPYIEETIRNFHKHFSKSDNN